MNEILQTVFGLLGGLAIFIFGMNMMSESLQKAAGEKMKKILGILTINPVMGVLAGALTTAVLQSSSATIAVLQNFASQAGPDGVTSIMGLAGAIPVLLGDNIGTTITALIACIGQSRDAKRTALAHCTFNISGALLFIWFTKPYAQFITMISTKGPEVEVIARQIANAHTVFNITMTLIWLPLIWLLVKIVTRIIPDGKTIIAASGEPLFLDDKMMGQPAAALEMAAREVLHCSDLVCELLDKVKTAVGERENRKIEEINEDGNNIRKLYNRIMEYLANMFSAGVLTEEQASQTAGLMYILSDVDRMGMLCTEAAESVKGGLEKKNKFSKDATKDITESLDVIEDMYKEAMTAIRTGELENARKITKKKEKVLDLDINMRKNHVKRVNKGKCRAELTSAFTTVLHSIDRMGSSCANIADAALSDVNFGYFIQEENEKDEE